MRVCRFEGSTHGVVFDARHNLACLEGGMPRGWGSVIVGQRRKKGEVSSRFHGVSARSLLLG